MKFVLSYIIIAVCSFSVVGQTTKKVYQESGFSASFPESVKVENNVIDSELGKINMILYLAEGDDYMIMVSENKYPKDFLTKVGDSGLKGMLNGAKNGALNNLATQMGSKYEEVTNEDFLFNNKHTGTKFTGKVRGIDIAGKTFMRNNQMYQILTIGNVNSADVTTFINSFTLIE